jgi:hypothetical protein
LSSGLKNPQPFLISRVHFAVRGPNRRCLEGGRTHDSDGRNFSLSKWTLKHSYFPGLLVFLSGPIVIGASKLVTMRDGRRKEVSEQAGGYVSISSALEMGSSFTEKMTAL